jgi:hypothetical protein
MEIAETLPRTTPGTFRNTFVRFASLTTPVLWLRLKERRTKRGELALQSLSAAQREMLMKQALPILLVLGSQYNPGYVLPRFVVP